MEKGWHYTAGLNDFMCWSSVNPRLDAGYVSSWNEGLDLSAEA